MSSEPPFEHPPDHTRYGDPPPPPPRSLPRFLTPAYKIGCGLIFGFLLTQCCVCGTIGEMNKKLKEHLDERFDRLEKKFDDANKKPDDVKKDETNKKDK